jgi:hypothetical protein
MSTERIMVVEFTKHAKLRLKERNLIVESVKKAVKNYDIIESDRFDSSIVHYIKKVDDKFLRVIAKRKDENTLLVISAFYDRRLKKGSGGRDD